MPFLGMVVWFVNTFSKCSLNIQGGEKVACLASSKSRKSADTRAPTRMSRRVPTNVRFPCFSYSTSGGGHRGGGEISLHFCGSPDPFAMQQNDSFVPFDLRPREGIS